MKITIKGHKHVEDKPEAVMELFLEQNGKDCVTLRGYDARGIMWNIATISADGIYLYSSISVKSGWPLGDRHRLKLL